MLKINPAVAAIEEETAFTVLDRANALKAKGHPVINLGIGQPDFTPPKHILEAAEKAVRDGFNILVLSDRGVDADHLPIPALSCAIPYLRASHSLLAPQHPVVPRRPRSPPPASACRPRVCPPPPSPLHSKKPGACRRRWSACRGARLAFATRARLHSCTAIRKELQGWMAAPTATFPLPLFPSPQHAV